MTSLVDWNFLIIVLRMEMGNFYSLVFLLNATFYFVKLNNLFLQIKTTFFGFTF